MRNRFLNSTTLVFGAVILLLVVWIGSGVLFREPQATAERASPPLPTVAASWSEAEDITLELVLYGEVEPAQISAVRARTDGIVEETTREGTHVQEGDVVAQLSADDRQARLARAQASVAAAERDYNAARQLLERNVGSEAEAQTRFAQLEASRAELRAIEVEIANTRLEAPISGVVNRVDARVGAYVSPGGELLEIVDNDPLVAVVRVQQADISRVRMGMPARVRFIGDAEEREGSIRFVAPIADANTRTFRVEVEIENSGGELPSGLSAEVVIPTGAVAAHRVSPALGRLDAQGRLGVYIVNADEEIEFALVEVVRARADGVWVSGLPEQVQLVTISQGTLAPGQKVEVRPTPPEYLQEVGGSGVAPGEAEAPQSPATDTIGSESR